MGKNQKNPASSEPDVLYTAKPGVLRVGLSETKDSALSAEGLKALVNEYATEFSGVGLLVWNHKSQEWVKLEMSMLEPKQ